MTLQWTRGIRIALGLLVYLTGVSVWTGWFYQKDRLRIEADVDRRLTAGVAAAVYALGEDYHDRYQKPLDLDRRHYWQVMKKMSRLRDELDLKYLYTMVEVRGKIRFTSDSPTEEEFKTGDWTNFLEHYYEASDGLKKTFKTKKPGFDEYKDRWGEFRSYFEPRWTPAGRFFVVGADIPVTELKGELRAALVRSLMTGLVLAGFSLPLIWILMGFVLQDKRELELAVTQRTKELSKSNLELEEEIRRRTQAQAELERLHQEMVEISRRAGMAELATGVLHNAGNVLNSLVVSAKVLKDRLKKDPLHRLRDTLKKSWEKDPGLMPGPDSREAQLMTYLEKLCDMEKENNLKNQEDLHNLEANLEHLGDIITMQQSHAKPIGMVERLDLATVIDDALRLQQGAFRQAGIRLDRDLFSVAPIMTERHKVLQILVNLLKNAVEALEDQDQDKRLIQVLLRQHGDQHVAIIIHDNGKGISAENLKKLFSFGFTTRQGGKGFGLHMSALCAYELGGTLNVQSDGVEKGSSFKLILPLSAPEKL